MPTKSKSAAIALKRKRRRDQERRRRAQKRIERPFVRSSEPRVTPERVNFISMQPTRVRGVRRVAWQVTYDGKRAGTVAILCHERDGRIFKASIDVQLNKSSRGRGIGTVAFRRASELSGFDQVFAIIAKKNLASRIAAARAGFVEMSGEPSGELVLVWRRKT
jgi:L-amino acid N-acyltransferase YncA